MQSESGFIVLRVLALGLVSALTLLLAMASQALEIQFNLRVPVTCVAQESARTGDRIDLNLFCNNGRGGDLRAHASLNGAPVTVRVDGRSFNLRSGQTQTILSREMAFRERVSLSIASSAAPQDRVALLFQISPK